MVLVEGGVANQNNRGQGKTIVPLPLRVQWGPVPALLSEHPNICQHTPQCNRRGRGEALKFACCSAHITVGGVSLNSLQANRRARFGSFLQAIHFFIAAAKMK